MDLKVILHHRSGGRSGAVDEFLLNQQRTITLGRDPSCDVAFDPERDEITSRQHARITATPGDPPAIKIADLGSRNGTYVNRRRINSEVALGHGDLIQFGPGGPEVEFRLDPPPAAGKPTVLAAEFAGAALPTREVESTPPPPAAVGRATVERLIDARTRTFRKTAAIAIAAVAAAVGVASVVLVRGGLFGIGRLSPAEIARRNAEAVVFLEVGWKIVDIQSGRQLYHVAIPNKQTDEQGQEQPLIPNAPPFLPAFAVLGDQLEPVLSTSDGAGKFKPIGGSHTGTGFLVSSDGFLLTNRHVAAAWLTRYQWSDPVGIVLQLDEQANVKALQPIGISQFPAWVPANARFVIEGDFSRENIRIVQKPLAGKSIEGHNDYLDVTLAGNRVRIPAKLARVSDQIDLAMCKIDVPQPLKKVELYDSYDTVAPGQVVAVLGYPAASPPVVGAVFSRDVFNRQTEAKVIPDPTLSVGNVGRVIREQVRSGGEATFSTFGDVYQLTVNSTGPGNSGGPVFDDRGRVIGVFTSGTRGDVVITFAVPIRYGIELMGTQRVM
jgi:S1-C subfamily serine protease